MTSKIVAAASVVMLMVSGATEGVAQRGQKSPPPIVQNPSPPPVVIQTVESSERFGDWTVYPVAKGAFATTANESGSAFGVSCTSQCSAFFNFQTACTKGHNYPALVNTSSGSFSVMLNCTVISDRYLLAMALNDTLIDALSIGGELGVAFPLESGRFQVSRYSLTGGLRAASRALEYGKQRGGADQTKGLKDYTL